MEMEFVESNEVLLEAFLSSLRLKNNSQNTINGYRVDVSKMFGKIDKHCLQIDSKDLNLYFLGMSSKAPKTVARSMAAVRSFYRWLKKNDYLKEIPIDKLETPKMPKRLPKYLTDEEVRKVIDVIKSHRNKTIVMLLYSSGMRISELWSLNRDTIDFKNKQMRIVGKGNKERTAFLNEETKEMLEKYLASRIDDNPALFVNCNAERLGRREIQKFMKKAGLDAGLKKPVTPHKMRHSFGSRMVQNGAPIQVVQQCLGHNDIATTQIYSFLDNKTISDGYRSVFDKEN
jgi:integrase/recombinase XerD